MILSFWKNTPFGKANPRKTAATALYEKAVAQSRAPAFYAKAGAPDTVEGRFEVLSIHVYLLLRRLKDETGDATQTTQKEMAQRLFDVFFRNMDDSLRELGVGDLSVGKKIRKMAEAFYGRAGAYETALDDGDHEALAQALARNVFGDDNAAGAGLLAGYMYDADAALRRQPLDAVMAGDAAFPPFEPPLSEPSQ